jgi:hypothetical protein
MTSLDDLRGRTVCSVVEGGRVVGLGRSAAYAAAREYLESGGERGLPCIRFGRLLVVPIPRLLQLLGADGLKAKEKVDDVSSPACPSIPENDAREGRMGDLVDDQIAGPRGDAWDK